MYHKFSIGETVSSHFGVATIIDHIESLTWGFEVKRHSDGHTAWLSADEMNPLRENLIVGDMIGARDHNSVEHIGMVTAVEGELKAAFGCGEHTVTVDRITWVVMAEEVQFVFA